MLRKLRTYISRTLHNWLMADKEETWYYKVVEFIDETDTKVYKFCENVKQAIKWLPIIWGQRDWDWIYVYELLLAKFKFMKQHFEVCEVRHVGIERDIEYLNILIKLLEEIVADDFGLTSFELEDVSEEERRKIYNKIDSREKKVKRLFWKIMENRLEKFWI